MMSRTSSPPLSQAASEAPQDDRLFAPATARNRAPIAAVLARWLPPRGCVLELASGSSKPFALYRIRRNKRGFHLPPS